MKNAVLYTIFKKASIHGSRTVSVYPGLAGVRGRLVCMFKQSADTQADTPPIP